VKYFGGIPTSEVPATPDLTEPAQTREKMASRVDTLANRPALAFAYHMPARNTPEYFAMGLLDQMLVEGDDSLLYEALVKKRGFTGEVSGGINELGNMFDYGGPMLFFVSLIHDPTVKPEQILAATDAVIDGLQSGLVDQKLLDRNITKMRSALYDAITQFAGFGRADILASFALFDDDPSRINSLEAEFRKVTPELIQKTAQDYLRKTNRTVLVLEAGKASPGGKPDKTAGAPGDQQ
jgi:zinc protease